MRNLTNFIRKLTNNKIDAKTKNKNCFFVGLYEQFNNKLIEEDKFKSKYYEIQNSFYDWLIKNSEIYGSKIFYEKLINKAQIKKNNVLNDQKLFWINFHAYKKWHMQLRPSRLNTIAFIFYPKIFLFTFYNLLKSRFKEEWYKKMRRLN